jgi:rod shape-determining protein MreC
MMLEPLRGAMTDAVAPVLDLLSRPLATAGDLVARAEGMVELYRDNEQLRADKEKLLRWQQIALKLAGENEQLRGLLKLVPEAAVSYVTARVIANAGGAFVRSLMVNAGSDSGVARGQAAITGEGLVGRVSEVGRGTSRVLLMTDLNSRIPVTIDGSHEQAVLAGDNSERPRLQYLTGSAPLKIGDRVVTSGQGGVFPPGLPVGLVASLDGGTARIEPYVELSQTLYIRIVDYGLAGALPQPVPVAPRAARHPRAAATDEPAAR